MNEGVRRLVATLIAMTALSLIVSTYTPLKQHESTASAESPRPNYEEFLMIISDNKFNVYPIAEYNTSYKADRINILLRHDADFDVGYGMASLDQKHGVRSTFYVRLHAEEYNLSKVMPFYKDLESKGFEIGYHYEVVDLAMVGSSPNNEIARKLFRYELEYLRNFFNIRSVAAHGGVHNHKFREWNDLREYGVISAYKIPFHKGNITYLSDGGDQFKAERLDYFKAALEKLKSGDVVQILIHPHPPRWNYETDTKEPTQTTSTPKLSPTPTPPVTMPHPTPYPTSTYSPSPPSQPEETTPKAATPSPRSELTGSLEFLAILVGSLLIITVTIFYTTRNARQQTIP